jgi:MYXO-CTERM domain-containing protein
VQQPLPRAIAFGLMGLLAMYLLPASERAARADGAFPDSLQVFAPSDRPDRIVLATNFGLLVTENSGARWDWICEQAVILNAFLYQEGPGPDDAIHAVNLTGQVAASSDLCHFAVAQIGSATSTVPQRATDVFPDPSDPLHVFAVGRPFGPTTPPTLYESHDGGRTFAGPRTISAPGTVLDGIEIARSNPQVVYVSMTTRHPVSGSLLRSNDGGQTFQQVDLGATLGTGTPLIAAVDPENPAKLYLRVVRDSGDALAITEDSGDHLRIALDLTGVISAFLRRANGHLLVATAGSGGGWISTDGGMTFGPWATSAHLRALAERNGTLIAAGDNFADHFAVGTSDDEGATWKPLFRFDQIAGPRRCGPIPQTCELPWENLVQLFGITSTVGTDAGTSTGSTTPPHAKGCGCAAEGGDRPLFGALLLVGLATLGAWTRSRARTAGAR